MRCERCQESMVDALYGELAGESRAEFDAHVAECAECTRALSGMQGTLHVMSRHERRDPGQAYWDGYWNRLSARMDAEGVAPGAERRPWWRWNILGAGPRAAWIYRTAAAATILVVGVFVGRTFFPAVAPVVQTEVPTVAETPRDARSEEVAATDAPAEAKKGGTTAPLQEATPAARGEMTVQPASANERAMRYLAKSQLLLIALVNSDDVPDAYAADIDTQRRRSRELVEEAPALRAELTGPKERRLRELVGELEKILVQIANLESDGDVEGVEFIRSRVNEHDVLFKIDLEQMRTEGNGSASGSTQRSI